MNEQLIANLGRFVDGRVVTISETPGHVRLNMARSEVSLSILIPRAVLEWWVEVNDTSSGKKIEDWCDYPGYIDTDTPEQTLSEDMRTDVLRFIENAVARPLRMAGNGRTLEWNVGGDWLQAVPFLIDGEQRAPRGVRNA